MPLTTETTSFTKDVQGRYLCNNLAELMRGNPQAGVRSTSSLWGVGRSARRLPSICGSVKNRPAADCGR